MKISSNNDNDNMYEALSDYSKEGLATKQEAQLRIFAAQALNASGQFQNFLETAIDGIVSETSGTSSVSGQNYSSYTVSDNSTLDSIFDKASARYNVDKQLLLAVARTESNFTPSATSPHGAMGVMQLMPETAKSLGVKDAYDPYENIMGGAKLLRMLLDKYSNNRSKALAAYNAGSNAVDSYGGVPPQNEGYVRTVLGYYADKVQSPDASGNSSSSYATNYTADELKNAFSKFPEHQSYEAFLEELSSEMQNKGTPGDANQAYHMLLSSAKTAIDRVRNNLSSSSNTVNAANAAASNATASIANQYHNYMDRYYDMELDDDDDEDF